MKKGDFIVPANTFTPDLNNNNRPEEEHSGQSSENLSGDNDEVDKENEVPFKKQKRCKVRGAFSFDVAWSKRLIGYKSKKVVAYGKLNRKCKKCDNGHDPSTHNCRRNYYSSAKGMEPHLAKQLIVTNPILKSADLEVGVLIGDDDSSSLAACRAVSDHPIVKQSDTNHAIGAVKKQLYKISSKHKELHNVAIEYLLRNFSYAIKQNEGNANAIAAVFRSIPQHVYNDHSKCGTWCKYLESPETYDHTVLPGGLTGEVLHKELVKLFEDLATRADKFSGGVSSNINESLHQSMSSKAPKNICHSLSASSDYRFDCTVA